MNFAKVSFPVAVTAISLIVSGCQSPQFPYTAAPPRLNPGGPTLTVMPLVDERTNRAMDKVLVAGYLADVQRAIADEMRSTDQFKEVWLVTNAAEVPPSDLYLTPRVQRLEWFIPNYGRVMRTSFVVGLTTGLIGGSIYLSTGIDVEGHSTLAVSLKSNGADVPLLEHCYMDVITNRMAKASCDVPKTKALVMSLALQQSLSGLKNDLTNALPKLSASATPMSADPAAVPSAGSP